MSSSGTAVLAECEFVYDAAALGPDGGSAASFAWVVFGSPDASASELADESAADGSCVAAGAEVGDWEWE